MAAKNPSPTRENSVPKRVRDLPSPAGRDAEVRHIRPRLPGTGLSRRVVQQYVELRERFAESWRLKELLEAPRKTSATPGSGQPKKGAR